MPEPQAWCAGALRAAAATLAVLGGLCGLCGCAQRPPAGAAAAVPAPASALTATPAAPEAASGWTDKPGWAARHDMVAAANPLATEVGWRVLHDGGSALDAAIAVQMVLNLVEPQSSGIGGGAMLMHWDGRQVEAWDGRETAPAAADEGLFVGADGRPLPFAQAVIGGRAVATPGVVKMLEAAHRQHGRLPWARLFEPAIALAEQGFAVSPRLHTLLLADTELPRNPQARAYFYRADGSPQPVGSLLRNPALAVVLKAIAARGSAAFYSGPVAADLVARVQGHAVPGRLDAGDLAAYMPRQRQALCTLWLAAWRVCGFPPPSSGHLAMMQILGLLERLPPGLQTSTPPGDGVPGADWLHLYSEASRLAFADRAQFVADPDFVAAPGGDWNTLLDGAYLSRRAALIGRGRMPQAPAGLPGAVASALAPMAEQPEHGTSHVSVVDAQGDAVALTTTIESAFGAHIMADGGSGLAGGYLLNNEMTDFSFVPRDGEGRPIANRVQPGKRPRSSMSPTLVFDARSGAFVMALGSPGGPVIIPFVARTLVATLQWGLDAQRATAAPNFASLGGPILLESARFPAATVSALQARGDAVVETELTSGLQVIQRRGDGWFGGADPRREGVVMGH